MAYYVLMMVLLEGWRKAVRQPANKKSSVKHPIISVLIAARNEEVNIRNILIDLSGQFYPPDCFEVLIINDHSSDNTIDRIYRWLGSNSFTNFRLFSLKDSLSGKKAAITEGVSQAKGEIIVTTDADCRVPPGWLCSIATGFEDTTQLISGPVIFKPTDSIFNTLQVMEFASLVGMGASTLALNIPTICNGANLAYRKEVFCSVGGFEGNEHIPSGDDEFLLKKVAKKYPEGVKFNANDEAIVMAKANSSFQEFVNQRLRWAGKWRGHGIGVSSILAIFIFLLYGAVLMLFPLAILNLVTFGDFALLLGAKLLVDMLFITRVQKFLGIPFSITSFILLQFVYPLYVIFFGLTANFLRPDWKGRKI